MAAPPSPAFVDTNILVYSFVPDDRRHAPAVELIWTLMDSNHLRTSTQVLQQFFAVTTRKLPNPLTATQALAHIERFAVCPVVINDVRTIRTAAGLASQDSLSFWDALLIAAALQSGARVLYTEDLQHNRNLHGLRIVNPFVR